jgi:hypothetical protein
MQNWFTYPMRAAALAAVFLLAAPTQWQNRLEITDPLLTLDQGIIKPTYDRDAARGILSIGARL